MSLDRKLAYFGVSAIVIFIIESVYSNLVGLQNVLDGTIVGKVGIAYVVLAAVVPWIYLLERARNKVSKKQFIIYFLGNWLMAPYFLFKIDMNGGF